MVPPGTPASVLALGSELVTALWVVTQPVKASITAGAMAKAISLDFVIGFIMLFVLFLCFVFALKFRGFSIETIRFRAFLPTKPFRQERRVKMPTAGGTRPDGHPKESIKT
jgi:hypothetical protein